jgi:putative ABC transport system ATP-binding protein
MRDIIRLERLTKLFRQGGNDIRALDQVSLQVPQGQFLSIMGPSGSGKSTLLHLIGGLDKATEGEIFLEGRALSQMSDDEITLTRRRKIGFVFQFFNLLPNLTAAENVALPLLLDGKRSAAARPRVERLLEVVGLARRSNHKPSELSGGEMQRVAIARALVADPVLLLADEPTGNLDTKTGEEILSLIRAATHASGQTIVLVTHDNRAAAHGDRVVTLKDGRIEEDRRNTLRPPSVRSVVP